MKNLGWHQTGRSGGPAAKGLAPCILLRGQATAPTWGVRSHEKPGLAPDRWERRPRREGFGPCTLLRGQATAPTWSVRSHEKPGLAPNR